MPVFYSDIGGFLLIVLALSGIITGSPWSVGIITLEHSKIVIFFIVIEGCWLVATVATIEAIIIISIMNAFRSSTVNELLLWKVDKLSGCSKVSTLEGTDGGEGPAWATMSLVLDWAIKTFLNPVYVFGWTTTVFIVVAWNLNASFFILLLGSVVTKDSLVLVVSPVGELVMTEFKILGSTGVMLADELMVVFKSL